MSTAHHEAGHAVASYCRRIPINTVCIGRLGGTDGHFAPGIDPTTAMASGDIDGLRQQVEVFGIILCAGPEAQRLYDPRGFHADHAAGDWSMARRLLTLMSGDAEVREAYLNLYGVLARKLLQRPNVWAAVRSLADALVDCRSLAGDQATAVIRGAMGR
ncbi:MAG: hypothetical protein H6907_18765 [Hyphomicrobiales bacterium]|nr:hypothetical protein [Hyphomicrobiales bacterium]MCP5373777.1 hypothetical protein [Hyphomicrobiales bacterium]